MAEPREASVEFSVTPHCSANEDLVAALQEHLQEKENRIQQLESVKLTKGQMEKLKTLKDERNMYLEEAKTLKMEVWKLQYIFDKSFAQVHDLKMVNSKLLEGNEELRSQMFRQKVAEESVPVRPTLLRKLFRL